MVNLNNTYIIDTQNLLFNRDQNDVEIYEHH
jgi:hypothetical protein